MIPWPKKKPRSCELAFPLQSGKSKFAVRGETQDLFLTANCDPRTAFCIYLGFTRKGGPMRATLACFLPILLFAACSKSPNVSADGQSLSGEKAMDFVRSQVAFGPRPPGSPALQKCREYLIEQLRGFGYKVEDDAFTAKTPYGNIPMHNLIARKGQTGKVVVALAIHYDSKLMEGIHFVGANDAGSSTGLLLELARVMASRNDPLDYWFVFLDGEEAFVEWSTFDSTYGSRHLAQVWKQQGIVPKIKALVLLDMIGDKDLGVFRETNSTPWLMDLVWDTAKKNGLAGILSAIQAPIEDDHLPFLDVGIPAVDIIDLDYGPGNSFHHTDKDTLDRVSPESMEKVGRLVLLMLPQLNQRLAGR
jgi:glutaminyl-peptide cyclotransferase